MPRKRKIPLPVIREVEGFTKRENGGFTFTDDFTGEVKPVLTGEARKAAPNPLSGIEFDKQRHEAKLHEAAETLDRARYARTRTISVDQYIRPSQPNQIPLTNMKVKDKPSVVVTRIKPDWRRF